MIVEDEKLDALAGSIGQMMAMQEEQAVRCAVELYRAMFRHEFDLDMLDRNYADAILGNVYSEESTAAEDYRNYLQYIKAVSPKAYPEYLKMYEHAIEKETEEEEA